MHLLGGIGALFLPPRCVPRLASLCTSTRLAAQVDTSRCVRRLVSLRTLPWPDLVRTVAVSRLCPCIHTHPCSIPASPRSNHASPRSILIDKLPALDPHIPALDPNPHIVSSSRIYYALPPPFLPPLLLLTSTPFLPLTFPPTLPLSPTLPLPHLTPLPLLTSSTPHFPTFPSPPFCSVYR